MLQAPGWCTTAYLPAERVERTRRYACEHAALGAKRALVRRPTGRTRSLLSPVPSLRHAVVWRGVYRNPGSRRCFHAPCVVHLRHTAFARAPVFINMLIKTLRTCARCTEHAAGAVDLDPLVHEGGDLRVRGRGAGKRRFSSLVVWEMMEEAGGLAHLLNVLGEDLHALHRRGAAILDRPLVELSCAAVARGHALAHVIHRPELADGATRQSSHGTRSRRAPGYKARLRGVFLSTSKPNFACVS